MSRVGSKDKTTLLYQAVPNEFTHKLISDRLKKLNPNIEKQSFDWFNEHGLRCDALEQHHVDRWPHYVFAGCSFTYGEGLPLEYTWPKIVHDYITKDNVGARYINISYPGASSSGIVQQILAYCAEFGIPNYLFINLPDFGREFIVTRTCLSGRSAPMYTDGDDGKDITLETLSRNLNTMIQMLASFGTDIYVGQWASSPDDRAFSNHVELTEEYGDPLADIRSNMVQFGKIKIPYIQDLISKVPDYYQPLLEVAADDCHPGILQQMDYANSFIKYFEKGKPTV